MKLAVFRGKYSNTHFVLESEEDWYRICMDVFQKRDEMGYFLREEPEEPDIEKPEKSEDMPDWAKKEYANQLKKYESRWSGYRKRKRNYLLYEKARSGSLEAARDVIEMRNGGEYEGYEIVETCTPNEDIPYWETSSADQIEDLEKALKRLAEDVSDKEAQENAAEAIQRVSKQSNEPSKGKRISFHKRSDRKLLKYNLQRILNLIEGGDIEEAERVSDRIVNRLPGWKKRTHIL